MCHGDDQFDDLLAVPMIVHRGNKRSIDFQALDLQSLEAALGCRHRFGIRSFYGPASILKSSTQPTR
jgi:hypothetical protein